MTHIFSHSARNFAVFLGIFGFASLGQAQSSPPFSDTAGTVFDIITQDDPSVFSCLEDSGRGARQIWDKRVDGEPTVEAYIFTARYNDGTNVEVAINPEFGSQDAAQTEALRFAEAVGRLPTVLRDGMKKLSIHKGDESFHAGTGQVIMYSGTADQRETYNHLEESLFHEAVHASLDAQHRLAPEWIAAQEKDGRFLTGYGERVPEREDLAETALFAFAILHHPDRFPPADTQDTLNAVPNRMDYIEAIFPKGSPLHYSVGDGKSCN